MFAKYNFTSQGEENVETFSVAEIRNLGMDYIEVFNIYSVQFLMFSYAQILYKNNI